MKDVRSRIKEAIRDQIQEGLERGVLDDAIEESLSNFDITPHLQAALEVRISEMVESEIDGLISDAIEEALF